VKIILACLLLINFTTLRGQPLKWHSGSVVLESGQVITGRMSIEPLHHLILFENDTARTVYPSHSIKSVYFYDELNNINRKFLSVRCGNSVRKHYELFEIVIQGDVTFLRQQKFKTNMPSDAFDFAYYVLYEDDMVYLQKFRTKIYTQLLARAGESMKRFLAVNNIKTIDDENSIRIIDFFNGLIKSDETIAKY
jgi:hypothetical protein